MATLITKNSSTASAVPAAGDLVKGELAVNVTDKKVYTKDNSAAVVKLVGSLGNQEANAVAITGGAINGTTIGATTPSTGAFTTASASGGFTGNLTGNVTGNVSGTAANVTGVVAIANGGTGLSSLGTGVQSALGQAVTGSGSFVLSTSPSLTTPNLGTPSAAVLTNATGLPLTTGVTGTLGVANGGTGITAFGTGVATALGQNVTGSGGIVLATSPSLTTPNLGTPSAATLTNATGLPISTGVSGLGTGVATALAVNTGSSGAFVVNGGALGTPSSGTVTNLTGTASININGTVGATTPTTGAFTTLSASGNITVSGGTANGVAYLNGSKVLTTGGTLTFDGTTLRTGTSSTTSPGVKINMDGVGTQTYFALTSDPLTIFSIYRPSGANNLRFDANYGGFVWGLGSAGTATEAMALTSTGLGIGTTAPTELLSLYRAANPYIVLQNSSTGTTSSDGGYLGLDGLQLQLRNKENDAVTFWTNNTERARITAAGDVGIGTSSPGERLDVVGTARVIRSTGATNTGDQNTVVVGATTTGAYASSYGAGLQFQVTNSGGGYSGGRIVSRLGADNFTANLVFQARNYGYADNMVLDPNGNLGIGTSSPASRFDVQMPASTNGGMTVGVNGTMNGTIGTGGFSVNGGALTDFGIRAANNLLFATGSGAPLRMTLDSSGNLGLGVTPSAWFSSWKAFENGSGAWVYPNNITYWHLTQNAFLNTSAQWIYKNSYAASRYDQEQGSHKWYTAPSGTAGNTISFTQAMTLDASGKLALNTTSASGRLTVYNSTAADFTSLANLENSSAITINSNQATSVVTFQGGSGGNPDKFIAVDNYGGTQFFSLGYQNGATRRNVIQFDQNDTIYFSTAGTERARITSGGYFKASDNGAYVSSTGAYHELRNTGNSQAAVISCSNASFTNTVAVITASRITTNSTYNLIDAYNGDTTGRFIVRDSGNAVNTNNSYGAISDIKLKENITDATPKLASLNQLRVVNYNFKGSDLKQIGLVAQEVEQVFPGLVETSADRDAEGNDLGTTTKSVKYSVLVPMLLKAVQELTAMNDDLRARVAQLEAK